jgi:hypothetical protein
MEPLRFNITSKSNPIEVYQQICSQILSKIETIPDSRIRDITKKAVFTINTPIYAAIVYTNTQDLEASIKCHDMVSNEAHRILFLDEYYETGEDRFKTQAEKCFRNLVAKLNQKQAKELTSLEKKLFTYWDYEQELSTKMKNREAISLDNIEKITLKKSTDMYLYSLISGFLIDIPQEIVRKLYHQQLLRDFNDDMRDLSEDFERQRPNPLLLRLSKKMTLNLNDQYSQTILTQLVKTYGVDQDQRGFIENYIKSQSTSLPKQNEWIQKCNRVPIKSVQFEW